MTKIELNLEDIKAMLEGKLSARNKVRAAVEEHELKLDPLRLPWKQHLHDGDVRDREGAVLTSGHTTADQRRLICAAPSLLEVVEELAKADP